VAISDYCLPGMASLAELVNIGKVTWTGAPKKSNDFTFTLTGNKALLTTSVNTKVAALREQWLQMAKSQKPNAFPIWTTALTHLMLRTRLDISKFHPSEFCQEWKGRVSKINQQNIGKCNCIYIMTWC
jgi:hypothetical protein